MVMTKIRTDNNQGMFITVTIFVTPESFYDFCYFMTFRVTHY